MMTRHAFEVYTDQIERLRELAFRERMAGEVGSMSTNLARDSLTQSSNAGGRTDDR